MNTKQIKMKFYLTKNKKAQEKLFVIDNTTKKTIISQTFELGDIIISIINNYNTIVHIFNIHIQKIDKRKPLSTDETFICLEKLKNSLNAKGFNIISELLDIGFFKTSERIEEIINYDILSDSKYAKFQGSNVHNHYIRKKGFRDYSFLNFLVAFKKSLKDIKEYTEIMFNLSTSKNDINIYTELPKMYIEYTDSEKSDIQSYTYNINNLKDLFLAVIHDLRLSNKFILKCECCGNLFIPKTNKKEQKYCYATDEYGIFTCRNKGRKRMYYYRMKEKATN